MELTSWLGRIIPPEQVLEQCILRLTNGEVTQQPGADLARWQETLTRFRADLQALQDIVADPRTDLAGIGFINYILWKIYGNRGIELTGFLGGLVNSSVATWELAQRTRETQGQITDVAYRGILLAMAAMVVRNAVLLAILAPYALHSSAAAFRLMFIASVGLAFIHRKPVSSSPTEPETPVLHLTSPFSLKSALKFGFLLVVIQVAGVLGQQTLGQFGVYVTSLLGGLFSSSSAVAAAATLASHGTIPSAVAGTCAVIASLTSVVVNLPLVSSSGDRSLITRPAWAIGIVGVIGGLGAVIQAVLFQGV